MSTKKNIIIYAPAITSQTGGAHSILENFLKSISLELTSSDNWKFIGCNEYFELCDRAGIEFQELNLNQKWISRIIYDFYLFKKMYLTNESSTIVISLQNTTPAVHKNDKTLTYIHQAIPFIKNFNPSPVKNFKLFLIKHFYLFFIATNISKTNSFFIVQSEWLKKICVHKLNIPIENFIIHRPLPTDLNLKNQTQSQKIADTFFYPSIYQEYKNHQRLIQAFIMAARENPNRNFSLALTTDNRFSSKLPSNLSINYLGKLSRLETIHEVCRSSAVIFPSLVESYGMPIAEAMYLNTPVLASNFPFAKELLESDGIYFEAENIESIKNAIVEFKPYRYTKDAFSSSKFQDWNSILENFLYKIKK